nr:hypothetical protein [Brevundimonas diminuta]
MSGIHFTAFPRTRPPPPFADVLVGVFESHRPVIGTLDRDKG